MYAIQNAVVLGVFRHHEWNVIEPGNSPDEGIPDGHLIAVARPTGLQDSGGCKVKNFAGSGEARYLKKGSFRA
jgi:hypothetical protein